MNSRIEMKSESEMHDSVNKKLYRFDELVELWIDNRGKSPPLSESGIPLIEVKNITGDEVYPKLDDSKFISQSTSESWLRKHLEPMDILISTVGTTGKIAMVPESPHIAIAQNLLGIRFRKDLADSEYMYFLMKGWNFQNEINARLVTTVQNSIKKSDMVDIKINLPSLTVQKRIAAFLSSIELLIEAQVKIKKKLSTIFDTLFRSWFIDFDPVKAKSEGELPYGMDEKIALLFPDSFKDSKFGEIPNGWGIEKLDCVIDYKEGPGIRNWQYVYDGKGTNFININCIRNDDLDVSEASQISNEEANGRYSHFHLKERDLVISTSGTLGRYAVVRKEHLPLVLNTSVIRFRPKHNCNLSFLIGYVKTGFQHELQSMASGSVQMNFGPMHLRMISLVYPPIAVLNAFDDVVSELIEMQLHITNKSHKLSELREQLLPRLMSGELKIN